MPDEEERVYTIPLRKEIQKVPRTKRAPEAIKEIKTYISRHMEAAEPDVWIDPILSEHVWSNGREKPPGKVRVRAIKFEDGIVEVSLQDR